MSTSPSWPSMTEYQEAIQSPKICFADIELRQATPVLNKLGLPRPVSGQFASVYDLQTRQSHWAIKCFLRNIPDLHDRYAKIADHLTGCALPYFVTFDYLTDGILVRGHFFPIVRMEWVDGLPLNHFLEKNLSKRGVLEKLEQDWLTMLADLQSVNVAHADLQYGNVLVAPDGRLRLIDYDGMWVPQLDGEGSHEIGHPDYQNPLRTGQDFHAHLDEFAGDVILIALRALQRRPELWDKYNTGENLLFRRSDFLEPADAELFAELRQLGDDEINETLDGLIDACSGAPRRGPSRHFTPRRGGHDDMDAPGGNVVRAAGAASRGGTAVAPARATARRKRVVVPGAATGGQSSVAVHPVRRKARPMARRPAAPATAPPADSGFLLGFARFIVHLLLLSAVTLAARIELPNLMAGRGDGATMVLGLGFGTAVVLGVLSLLSIFGRRPIYHTIGSLFFALAPMIILLVMFAELAIGGWSRWTGNDGFQAALMLTMLGSGAVGLLLQHAWQRQGELA